MPRPAGFGKPVTTAPILHDEKMPGVIRKMVTLVPSTARKRSTPTPGLPPRHKCGGGVPAHALPAPLVAFQCKVDKGWSVVQ